MAAEPKEVQALIRKMRDQGLDDATVIEGLRGMGYTQKDAAAAVSSSAPAPTSAPTTEAPLAGQQPAQEGSPAPSSPARPSLGMPDLSGITLTPPKKLSGGDVGGFLAGLLIYTLALNYLRYGPGGPTAWMSAKFLNQPRALGKDTKQSSAPTVEPASTGLTSTKVAPPAPV